MLLLRAEANRVARYHRAPTTYYQDRPMTPPVNNIAVTYYIGPIGRNATQQVAALLHATTPCQHNYITFHYLSLEDYVDRNHDDIAMLEQALADAKIGALTVAQYVALHNLCARYETPFDPTQFIPDFGSPDGWVLGRVGPITVGCDPTGRISS